MSQIKSQGKIHLGDLVIALAKLDWQDEQQANAIVSCLGFGLNPVRKTQRQTEIYDHRLAKKESETTQNQSPSKRINLPPAPKPPPALPSGQPTGELVPLANLATATPEETHWENNINTIFKQVADTKLVRQNLFPDRNSRHLFSAALATSRKSQEIDIHRLIEVICTEHVILDLPRSIETTLESGCQLILDYSQTMVPWWDDLIALTQQVKEVIGTAKTQAFSFDTLPANPMRWTANGKRRPWRADGRPVLLISDFGIQGKEPAQTLQTEWFNFIDQCEQSNSPLIILNPWPAERWPKDTGGYPELLHWSPHTTATMIKKAVGSGHKTG